MKEVRSPGPVANGVAVVKWLPAVLQAGRWVGIPLFCGVTVCTLHVAFTRLGEQ